MASYERRFGLPLLLVSIAYLAVVLVEMLPGIRAGAVWLTIDGVFWAVFVVDYVWRVGFLAPNPLAYMRKPLCLLDLFVVASFPILLILGTGTLGLARVARVVAQFVRFIRGGAQAARIAGQAQRVFSRRSLRWVLPLAMLFVVFAAIFVWRFEMNRAGTEVDSLGDALWWALCTITTVGYGDVVPETTGGRIAGVVLILVGICSFGWLTASLASLFVGHDESTGEREVLEVLKTMDARLAAIEAEMGISVASSNASDPPVSPMPLEERAQIAGIPEA